MNAKLIVAAAVVCASCVSWTRLAGRVKGINLKESTVTIQNKDGDLLTVPIDYQVKITEGHGETRDLKHLELDEKIVLLNTPSNPGPLDDTAGLAAPEPTQKGR